MRAILYMSAVTASQRPGGMQEFYNRLLENKKEPMVALGAIMRRQLVLMRALLVSGKDYEKPVEKKPEGEQKAVA